VHGKPPHARKWTAETSARWWALTKRLSGTLFRRLGMSQLRDRWAGAGARAPDRSGNLLEVGGCQLDGGGVDPTVDLLG
jgi:hypothetical protein